MTFIELEKNKLINLGAATSVSYDPRTKELSVWFGEAVLIYKFSKEEWADLKANLLKVDPVPVQ